MLVVEGMPAERSVGLLSKVPCEATSVRATLSLAEPSGWVSTSISARISARRHWTAGVAGG